MPKKESAGPRGINVGAGGGAGDLVPEAGLTPPDGVLIPPAVTPLLLQLLGRVSDLESAARTSRILGLESRERVQVLVLGDQEAQAEIQRLQTLVTRLEADLSVLSSGETVDEGTIAELRLEVETLTIQLATSDATVQSLFTTIGSVGAVLIQLGNAQLETTDDIRQLQSSILAQAAALAASNP